MDINLTGIFIIAVFASLSFGFVGFLTKKEWWAWAIWGGLAGLTIITASIGLAHAAAVPYAGAQLSRSYMVGGISGTLIILLAAAGSYFAARNPANS